MKRRFMLLLMVLSCLVLPVAQASGFSGGNGDPGSPYIITTAAELNNVRNHLTRHFRLGNNIDLAPYLASPNGGGFIEWGAAGWMPIGAFAANNIQNVAFSGSFDGAGYVIRGFWINRGNTSGIGLFGAAYGATIRNLGVEITDFGVRGSSRVGGLTGHLDGGSVITNCYVTGNITSGGNAGGLAGSQTNSNIANSYATGNVTGSSYGGRIGGLVGTLTGTSSIKDSYARGNVSSTYYGSTGGLVGYIGDASTVINSYATGNVTGPRNYNQYSGGLAGRMEGNSNIAGSIATGNVTGYYNNQTGGLVGTISNSFIVDSYRYNYAEVNGAVLTENNPSGRNGGILTPTQLTSRTTYSNNGWHFSPSGPWHWDGSGFPKLNMGAETYPFPFNENIPIISINRQPAASTTVRQGSINATLSVSAEVTLNATLAYQWYSNTSASNAGGTAIAGATSASYGIPRNLTPGT